MHKITVVSLGPGARAHITLGALETLEKGGYKVKLAEPYDLFPHTEHVETIVMLERETFRQDGGRKHK